METKTKQILDTLQKKRIEFLRRIANVIDLSPEDIVEILPPIRLQVVVSEDSHKKESNIKRGPGRPRKKITPADNLICQAMVKPRPNKKKKHLVGIELVQALCFVVSISLKMVLVKGPQQQARVPALVRLILNISNPRNTLILYARCIIRRLYRILISDRLPWNI